MGPKISPCFFRITSVIPSSDKVGLVSQVAPNKWMIKVFLSVWRFFGSTTLFIVSSLTEHIITIITKIREMNRYAEELRKLKKDGVMVRTDDYIISYNPFTDTYVLDVPEDKKILEFFIFDPKYSTRTYQWDMSGMYPYPVEADDKSYEQIWKELEPYSKGALTKMIPASFKEGMDEYVMVDTDEDGLIPIKRSDIIKYK